MVRPMVEDMFEALMFDCSLRMAMIVDFGLGINGSKYHSALQRAVRAGATVDELDEALGDGKKISTLVEKYTTLKMDFTTDYDKIKKIL